MAPNEAPAPPPDLCAEAQAFWIAVTTDYFLEPHQLALLETAARAKDMEVRCQGVLDRDGLTIATGQGMIRARPEATILRDASARFVRAYAALRLGDDK